MDEMYKNFSINFYNRLKNTVDASVYCNVNEDEDKMYITIERLGIQYKTCVENVTFLIQNDISLTEMEFDKVIKRYRSFINHKFFR